MKRAGSRRRGASFSVYVSCVALLLGAGRQDELQRNGYGPWEFGMRHFQVSHFADFGPYLPVERTGGLETHNGVFEGAPAKIAFLFKELALDVVEISAYAGEDVEAMQSVLYRAYAYVSGRYGDLTIAGATLEAGLSEKDFGARIPEQYARPIGDDDTGGRRSNAAAPLQRLELEPAHQPDGARVVVRLDRAERRRVTTVTLFFSQVGEPAVMALDGAVEGVSGRAEVVNTTNWLQARMLGADEYAQRAGGGALLNRYPGLRTDPDAHLVELLLGPTRVEAAIVGNFSRGFELHLMPPAVDEPVTLRFARDGERFVLTTELSIQEERQAEPQSYPMSVRLVLHPEDALANVRIYPFARRRGVVHVDGRELNYEVSGDFGVFNGWYDRVYFDLDGNGAFSRSRNSSEVVHVYEGYITMDGTNWQFDVERFGDKISLALLEGTYPARSTLDEGAMAPDFSFVDADGAERKLSDYRGRLVLLDFWGSWCGPCRGEAPHMVKAYERYRDVGFEIIGIDYDDSVANQEAFMERYGMTWPQVRESDSQRTIHDLYRNGTWPTHYLIGEDGRISDFNPRGGKLLELLEARFGR